MCLYLVERFFVNIYHSILGIFFQKDINLNLNLNYSLKKLILSYYYNHWYPKFNYNCFIIIEPCRWINPLLVIDFRAVHFSMAKMAISARELFTFKLDLITNILYIFKIKSSFKQFLFSYNDYKLNNKLIKI